MGADVGYLKSIALDWLAVDRLPRLILTRSLDIVWMNDRARDLLGSVPSVSLVRDALHFRCSGDEEKFGAYLRALGADMQTLALAYDGGDSHLLFRGRYIRDEDAYCFELNLDHVAYRPELADFASVFGLTGSEARTAIALFEGSTVTDVAKAHKVSVDTVRTHVRQIYAKLGTGSREQFFRRLQPFRIS